MLYQLSYRGICTDIVAQTSPIVKLLPLWERLIWMSDWEMRLPQFFDLEW